MGSKKTTIQLISLVIFLFLFVNLHGQEGQLIVLKNGTILKGAVLVNDEYKVSLVTANNDTLEYAHKYVQSVLEDTPDSNNRIQEGFTSTKYHKTHGAFVNIDVSAPLSISLGGRVNSSFNLGAQIMFNLVDSDPSWTVLIGIGPYAKYYFSKKQNRTKIFTDFTLGVAYRESSGSSTSYVPYSSVALGIQLPSRGAIRFYFKIGSFMVQNFREVSGPVGFSYQGYFDVLPQVTLLGIEF